MKKLIYIVIAGCMISGALAWAAEWTTDGADPQRTGWQKDEKVLNKDNVKNLKLLWKLKTDNVTRALFSFTPAMILDNVKSNGTTREMIYFVGASDNLYAVDANKGEII